MRLDLKAPEAAKVKLDCVKGFLPPTDIQIHVSWGTRLAFIWNVKGWSVGVAGWWAGCPQEWVCPQRFQKWSESWSNHPESSSTYICHIEQAREMFLDAWERLWYVVDNMSLAWLNGTHALGLQFPDITSRKLVMMLQMFSCCCLCQFSRLAWCLYYIAISILMMMVMVIKFDRLCRTCW